MALEVYIYLILDLILVSMTVQIARTVHGPDRNSRVESDKVT